MILAQPAFHTPHGKTEVNVITQMVFVLVFFCGCAFEIINSSVLYCYIY